MTEYEAVVLDIDGTIVRGDELLPGATDGIHALEEAGCSRLLFSNNPTRGRAHYGEKLAPHGLEVEPETVLTSATVTAQYLSDTHPGERVFLVGSPRLEAILEDRSIVVTTDPADANVVLGSFDRDFSYDDLAEALSALEGDTAFYGTDPDTTIPVDGGTIPGSGAILAAMEAASGREPDAILGKPSAIAAEAAMARLDADPGQTLVVGDRLDTDIALGKQAGMDTAVVLTGVTERADLEAGTTGPEPDHVLESLGNIETIL
ncbi:HAD-IIA family hydrolase [Natronolimnobius sp. AArcel1]|uniref:HAD-IIA family hydrolase n=1 Tax=Natronolimnobius sp. AArcel1 TaxID=1679093 RepID=UPI0013EB6AD0|nr:HAD-IIA family hydrolase [Natronolimnobius sp. AArcel1]NGM70940.1 HAD-IIA family hydrolase [Natronolimnobius sp. AArcel1]